MIYTGDLILHQVVEHNAWLRAHAWALGAATVTLAGLYQFTPLKYHCIDKCRSPLTFIMEHWRGRQERAQAFRLGAHHGLFCLGCCWSLMLLMFAVGLGNLGWMLALAAVMGVEKNIPWGRRLSAPLGVFLLGWSLALFMIPTLWGMGHSQGASKESFGNESLIIAARPMSGDSWADVATTNNVDDALGSRTSLRGLLRKASSTS
jgi:predicted metal-binding membrane protein